MEPTSDGNIAEAAPAEAAEAPQNVETTPTEAPDVQQQELSDDQLDDALVASLGLGDDQPDEPAPEPAAAAEVAEHGGDESEPEPEPIAATPEPKQINWDELSDDDVILVNGKPEKVSDWNWRDGNYKRLVQEAKEEAAKEVEQWKPFAQRWKHDPYGLILSMDQDGAKELATFIEQGLQQLQQQGVHNPMAAQQNMHAAQVAELEAQKRQIQFQQEAFVQQQQLERDLGRPLSPQEDQAIATVFQNWSQSQSVTKVPPPTMSEALELSRKWGLLEQAPAAQPAAQPRQPVPAKPLPKIERVNSPQPEKTEPTDHDLYTKAMASIGVSA